MKAKKKITTIGLMIAIGLCSCQSKAQSDENRKQRKPPSIDQLFKDLDGNEDGKLSENEVKGPLKKDFAQVDLNEDGFLTREELEKAPKPKKRDSRRKN